MEVLETRSTTTKRTRKRKPPPSATSESEDDAPLRPRGRKRGKKAAAERQMVEACKRVAEAERSVLEAMKKVGNNVKNFSKMLQEQIDTPQEKDVGAGKNGLQEAVIRLKAAAEEREQASQDRAQAASERTAAALRAQEERDRDSKERLDTLRILVGARESRFERHNDSIQHSRHAGGHQPTPSADVRGVARTYTFEEFTKFKNMFS